MTQSSTQFQIQSLRAINQQRILESILIFITALFVSALLPSLLIQYVYADQMLTEAPLVIEHMSGVTFAIAVLYLLYVLFGIFLRGKRIAQLEREMAILSDTSSEQLPDESELKELEALVDEALQSSKSANKSASKTAKKSRTKRVSKRKTTSKKS
jgi:hypothetical protein